MVTGVPVTSVTVVKKGVPDSGKALELGATDATAEAHTMVPVACNEPTTVPTSLGEEP